MKKVLVALVVALGLGLIASQALACWWGGYGGGGMMWGPTRGHYSGAAPSGWDYRGFMADTANLREELAAKQGEYDALMANPNPDPERAAQLSREMARLNDQLQAKAQGFGMHGRGLGWGHYGMGMSPGRGGYCWW